MDSRRSRVIRKNIWRRSPRREQIKDHLREMGIDGAGAAQVAAHRTRDSKELVSPGEVLAAAPRAGRAVWDTKPTGLWPKARAHEHRHVYEPDRIAQQAVTYARDHLFERSAVLDRRELCGSGAQSRHG